LLPAPRNLEGSVFDAHVQGQHRGSHIKIGGGNRQLGRCETLIADESPRIQVTQG